MSYRKALRGARIPFDFARRAPRGARFLGEDDAYYYYTEGGLELGGFGNMFKRMVKFTPKSFTPGNIYKGFINTALTTSTFGAYQLLPKKLKKTVYEIGKVAVPVIAGGVLAVAASPAVMAVIGAKLGAAGGILGKAAGAIGGPLFNMLGKFTGSQQAQIAEQITPQQIAQMEQTGQMPASLTPLLDQMSRQSLPQTSSGAAQLYDPSMMAVNEMTRMQGSQPAAFDWQSLLLLGVPAVGLIWVMGRRK
ncbi:MAG: hypothetical protein ACRCZI_12290 [Cetobacterium sp.]